MSVAGQPKPCRGCSCHNATDPTRDIQQLVDLAKTANDATAAMAEVARIQALSVLAVIERDSPKLKLAIATPAPPQTSAGKDLGSMVISERVGSISVEDWEGMSKDRLRDLDRALKRIVNTTMVSGCGWKKTGATIQRELAAVGLVFNTAEECINLNESRDWKEAENPALPDLVRMRAAASAARSDLGQYWWADEMVRIVVRLMELRGM